MVGDSGDLCEVRPDGECLRQQRVSKADLEGVTVDPFTGRLYVAVEEPPLVLELDADSWKVRRTSVLDRAFDGRKLFPEGGNNGVEDIAFVPLAGHPDGGVFYVPVGNLYVAQDSGGIVKFRPR